MARRKRVERAEDEDAPRRGEGSSPALALLRCSSCGSPLALAEGETAVCSSCGARTAIPAEHRALREASRWDAQARREAEAALHGFDRPPGPLLRAVAWASRVPFWAVFMLLGAPLFFTALTLAWPLADRIARLLGWPTGQEMSSALLVAVMGAAFWAMAAIPSFIVAYGGRRVTARARLMAALAAKRPARPGGPASCRSCGAPLTVEPEALVARCAYCRAESVLVVSAAHMKAARGATGALVTTIAEAAALDLRERAATRRQIAARIGRVTWKAGVAVGLWVYIQHGFEVAGQTDEAPGGAILACFVLVGFLIYLIMASMAGSGSREL